MKIKGWDDFQHFKDRTPPWIKLYRYLLDDPEWHELDGDTSKILVMLWLIASEDKAMQGNLPNKKTLCFRLRITETKLNQSLTKLNHWLIFDDINVISECYQVDAPETETEKRREDNIYNKTITPLAMLMAMGVSESLARDWIRVRKEKKQAVTQTALDRIKSHAEKHGYKFSEAIKISCENGWAGFNVSWIDSGKPIPKTEWAKDDWL